MHHIYLFFEGNKRTKIRRRRKEISQENHVRYFVGAMIALIKDAKYYVGSDKNNGIVMVYEEDGFFGDPWP